jgi:hypothetical protein
MFKSVISAAIIALSLNAVAAEKVKAIDISCKVTNAKDANAEAYIKLNDVAFGEDSATVKSYTLSVVADNGAEHGLVPDVSSGSFEGKELENLPYNGRKYKGHYKFDLTRNAQSAGNFHPDNFDLIISPEYTVAKTIPQQNHWDKTWTWDIEVRKHSAVVAANFNDHHGDYLEMDCYSIAHVNDSKGRH